MERNLRLLVAFCAAGVLGLAFFAQAMNTGAETVIKTETGSQSADVPTVQASVATSNPAEVQVVRIRALDTGFYDRQEVRVKAGVPVRLEFSADAGAGCGKMLLMPDFNVRLSSQNGETQAAEFTPAKGSYAYHCSMNMFRGRLIAE